MLLNLFTKDKTLKGSVIVLVVYLLNQAGIETGAAEIGGIVGSVLAGIGLIHKIIKKVKK